jgi:hypothetical protein
MVIALLGTKGSELGIDLVRCLARPALIWIAILGCPYSVLVSWQLGCRAQLHWPLDSGSQEMYLP